MFLGRVVASGEPLWTDEDRAWALAYLAEEAEKCSGCGHPLDESTDIRAEEEGWFEAAEARCHACTVKEARKETRSGAMAGLLIWAKRRQT